MDYNSTATSIDRRKIMESYFPEFVRGSKDFRVFIKLATEELGAISDYIELFTDLADADTTPEQFLQDLGEMVGYSYIDNVEPDVQREMIKRVFNKHQARGDEKSLLMMAKNAQNLGYVGGDLFVPGTYLQGQDAILTFPRDYLYTWNKSKRSGFDRYPDGIIAVDGVIEIVIGYFDDHTKQRTEKVKPAGVKLYFKMMASLTGDGVVVKIPIPSIMTNFCLNISRYIPGGKISGSLENTWSGRSGYMRRSGRVRQELLLEAFMNIFVNANTLKGSLKQLYYPQYTDEQIVSMYLAIPAQILKQFVGVPVYSKSFVWSGKYARSGLKVGVIETSAPYRHAPALNNTYLTMDELNGVYTSGYNNYVQSEFEITIERKQ